MRCDDRAGAGRPEEGGASPFEPPARIALVACPSSSTALPDALEALGARASTLDPDAAGSPPRGKEPPPDTVVVGRARPGLVTRLRRSPGLSACSILVLVPDPDPDLAIHLLHAGADDVVRPPHSAEAILLRRAVVLGRAASSSGPRTDLRRIGPFGVDAATRRVRHEGHTVHLSGREFALFLSIARGRGRAVSRARLVREVWGEGTPDGSTLDATVHRLRRRLDADGFPETVIDTVRGVGYRLLTTPAPGRATDRQG